jgi:transcriptional regulator with XRE-family HTH domain
MTDPLMTDKTVTRRKRRGSPTGLGARIEQARSLYGWSQDRLGKMIAKTRAAISQYEKDMIRPKPEVLDQLADIFNADPEWFTHGRGAAPKPTDVPLVIPEIDLTRFTEQHVDSLRDLRAGRDWRLPAGLFDGPVTPERLVGMRAPRACAPVYPGDRIIVDEAQRDDPSRGLYLIFSREKRALYLIERKRRRAAASKSDDPVVLGRVVAYFRAL